jgi:hypothetical protein
VAVPTISQADRETAIRILGAADGFAKALLCVQRQIDHVMSKSIPEHHTQKLAARDARLRDLIVLRDVFDRQQHECRSAYKSRMAGAAH